MDFFDATVKLRKTQAHAALDVLEKTEQISMSGNVRGIRYRITAQGQGQGQAYYLEHQDQ